MEFAKFALKVIAVMVVVKLVKPALPTTVQNYL